MQLPIRNDNKSLNSQNNSIQYRNPLIITQGSKSSKSLAQEQTRSNHTQ